MHIEGLSEHGSGIGTGHGNRVTQGMEVGYYMERILARVESPETVVEGG